MKPQTPRVPSTPRVTNDGATAAPHRPSTGRAGATSARHATTTPRAVVPVPPLLLNEGPAPNDRPTYRKGYVAQNGTQVKYLADWTKLHKVEGDGLLVSLYEFLVRSDKAGEHRLRSVCLPDTVIFDHNFPSAWYAYDDDSRELVKHPGRMLDANSIYEVFSRETEGCDIVAQFYHKVAPTTEIVPTGTRDGFMGGASSSPRRSAAAAKRAAEEEDIQHPSVEFFTKATLHTFLHSAQQKPDGVLQKFVVPKGKLNSRSNFQLQAVWSPLVTLVYKRTNNHIITDRAVGVDVRAASFDGPPHYSCESRVAASTQYRIDGLCKAIVDHFDATEGKKITRFVAYFKEDNKDRMWLLWASSLRVGGDKLNPVYVRVPLQLGLKVHGTAKIDASDTRIAQASPRAIAKQLLAKDIAMFTMTGDMAFARLCGADTDPARRSPSPTRNTAKQQSTGTDTAAAAAPAPAAHPHSPTDTAPDTEVRFPNAASTNNKASSPQSSPHPHHHHYAHAQPYCAARAPFLPIAKPDVVMGPSDERHPFHDKYVEMQMHDRNQRQQANTRGGTVRTSNAEYLTQVRENTEHRASVALAPASQVDKVRRELVSIALDTLYETYSMALRGAPPKSGARSGWTRNSIDLGASSLASEADDEGIPVELCPVFDAVLSPDEADELIAILGLFRARAGDPRGCKFVLPAAALTRGHRRDRPVAHVEGDVRNFFDRVMAADPDGLTRRFEKYGQATRRVMD